MSNFSFLVHEFEGLKIHALKSEMYAIEDSVTSAIYSRKALESSVKFIYKTENLLNPKELKKTELLRLMQNREFIELLPFDLIDEMHFVRKLGNRAVHSNDVISSSNAIYANKCIYKLQRWIVEVYSSYPIDQEYDATLLVSKKPQNPQEELAKSQREEELSEENAKLQKQIAKLKATIEKSQTHVVKVEGLSEKETRERLIDLELKEAGYNVAHFKVGVEIEHQITLEDGSVGYADYVIWSESGKPLAVIEAKKALVSVVTGRHQARRYTEALKRAYGVDVLTFVTNGRVIEYSDGDSAFREVHGIFPKAELVRALSKKEAMQKNLPSTFEIDNNITDRGYQKRVINSVLKNYEAGQKRALLVMATGTGKTRVSASLSKVLIEAGWVRRVLFLADRKELVRQATNSYSKFLDETTTNLVLDKKDLEARMHFGTYETVHNLIESGVYNPAFFDLVVVDEAHRNIYKKYRAIFEYFDAFVLGLTATPADEIHRNTYNFFQTSEGEPTDSYDLQRAIDDGNLVDFKPYEIDLGIVKRGIKYAELSDEEKEEFEEKFDEDEEEISSSEINQRVLNKETNEKVLQYLHQFGLKVEDGNKIGKSIIFAKNKRHAEYIKKVFDQLYPKRAFEAQIIHSEISHVESLIDNFKNPKRDPQIAISVDMLDTGIDVPELLNLVFFKPVKSKIKFWQMIGRGTRLCPNLFGEGEDKTHFNIFDFCENFTFFSIESNGVPSQQAISLKERLFKKRISLLKSMEESAVKEQIRSKVRSQVFALDPTQYHLKKRRHIVEMLHKADFAYLTDELEQNLKLIAEYINDPTDVEVQRFEMLTLNAQEAIVKQKDASRFTDELKERCKILKSKASSVNAIKKEEQKIDAVLNGSNPLQSIEELEQLKEDISQLANLSLGAKVHVVESDFKDRVEEVRPLYSKSFIKKATVETEVQKVLSEYIEKLLSIEALRENEFIDDDDIRELKHQVFEYEKILEDRLSNQDEFSEMMKEVMNSSKKEIANKIFDNYIERGDYTQKQIEVSNKIKNLLFGKKYATLEESLQGVNENLLSDFHPLATVFERLSDNEQEMIYNLMGLLSRISMELSSYNNPSSAKL